MRSRWVHESSTRASSLQNFALRSPSSFYLLMIPFLHRLSSSSSLREKKGKPQRPFQKVKEYRARVRSIPCLRNKLDDAPRLTSRYVNTYRCNISCRLGCRNRSAVWKRNDILYFAHVSLLLFYGFTKFFLSCYLYLRKRARREFYYPKLPEYTEYCSFNTRSFRCALFNIFKVNFSLVEVWYESLNTINI